MNCKTHDQDVAGLLDNGGPAFGEARQLIERLQPTLPIVLANLVSVGQVALTYQANIEQLLVLLPQVTAEAGGTFVANQNTKQDYRGEYLSFNLNLNLPPPCTTGFLPAQQRRVPTFEDYPERPPGDLYCRTPQDSAFNVRGAKNTPCVTRPGKRAPTVKLCESDEQYVPLNDGYNWKGDPNATLDRPRHPAAAARVTASWTPLHPAPAPPPIAVAPYDPATGTYVGPDGKVYTQSDLAHTAPEEKTWQNHADPAGELTLLLDDDVVDIEDYAAESRRQTTQTARRTSRAKEPMSAVRRAMLLGLVVVRCLGCSGGMVGISCLPVTRGQAQRSQFLQAARQGALNLTTIDWQQAERDVQRILDGATGQFHDDFAKRSQPFVDVVKKAKSTTVGTITEAGLESETADSGPGVGGRDRDNVECRCAEPDPRAWRMRISVQKVGDQAKVSNVEFVS